MARKIFFVVGDGCLRPAGPVDAEAFGKLKRGAVVSADVRVPRNLEHHRKFEALIDVVYRAQSLYPTREEFRTAFKVALGYYTPVTLKSGREIAIPKSISFASMDQIEFEEFYDRAVALICERILPRVEGTNLRREIEDIMQGRAA